MKLADRIAAWFGYRRDADVISYRHGNYIVTRNDYGYSLHVEVPPHLLTMRVAGFDSPPTKSEAQVIPCS